LTAFDDFFTALFIGNGNLLGLLLLVTLAIGIMLTWKYSGIITIVISVLAAFYYFDNALGWHGILMIFMSIFALGYMSVKGKKE